jgi:hypothetical protein
MIVPAADAALAVAYSPALKEKDSIKIRTTPVFNRFKGQIKPLAEEIHYQQQAKIEAHCYIPSG